MQSHFQRRPATALVTLGDRLRYRLHAGTGPDEGWILDELWVFHLERFWIFEDVFSGMR